MEMDDKTTGIGRRSNAERGHAICATQETQVGEKIVKAVRLRLKTSMTVEQAFEAIIVNCLNQVDGNEHGVIHGNDPESIHQMRVGIRRLRSALDLFEDTIGCPKVLLAGWKWIGSQLGAARDWEVLAESSLGELAGEFPDYIDVATLRQSALEQARKNREQAALALQSARYIRLRHQFMGWLTGKSWRKSQLDPDVSVNDLPVKKFARKIIRHGEHRLIKRGKHLRENEPESRHRVRIASKKARYATEFLQSLFAKKTVKPYLSTLSDLQQELGWLNDAAVAMRLLDQIQVLDPQAATPAAFVRGYLYAAIHGDQPRLLKSWKRFAKVASPH